VYWSLSLFLAPTPRRDIERGSEQERETEINTLHTWTPTHLGPDFWERVGARKKDRDRHSPQGHTHICIERELGQERKTRSNTLHKDTPTFVGPDSLSRESWGKKERQGSTHSTRTHPHMDLDRVGTRKKDRDQQALQGHTHICGPRLSRESRGTKYIERKIKNVLFLRHTS